MTWSADYYDGETAARNPTQVEVTAAGLRFDAAGRSHYWPYAEIRQTQGFHPGELVRLIRGDEPAPSLIISDRSILLETERHAPHLRQTVRDGAIGRTLLWLTALAVVGIVIVGVMLWFGIPAAGSLLARLVPVSVETKIGEMAADQITSASPVCTDSGLNTAIAGIADRLLDAAPDHPYTFQIRVTDDETMNALAAPGGHVIIFRGLVDAADSPEELAGVLAHEFQHVLLRHSMKALIRETGSIAVLAMVFGDAGGAAGIVRTLGSLQFQRSDEEEADRKGFEMLLGAGVDPAAMSAMFRKLRREAGDSPGALQYLSTHPNLDDRIAAIDELRANARAEVRPIEAGRWSAVKTHCR